MSWSCGSGITVTGHSRTMEYPRAVFLFQPLNGSKHDLKEAIEKGDKIAEKLATTFDPSAVDPYYVERGIGRNQYWKQTNRKYKITALDLALLYCRGNVATILIDRGDDIFTQDQFGNTPLHIAAAQGLDIAVIQLLEKIKKTKPQALDLQNNAGYTPLHFAVICDWGEVIKTLLDGGANPTLVDRRGNTALHLAIERNLSQEIIINISKASRAKAVDIVGYNEIKNPSGCSSGTMDHNGLDRNAFDAATAVILNLRNFRGHTPLFHALYNRRKEIYRIMLKLGADPTITDTDGNTALHLAIEREHEEIIIDIIGAVRAMAVDILGHNEMTNPSGCSSGTMDHNGLDRNAIGEAASKIFNLKNNMGRTALSHAVYYRREGISRILLKLAADPTIADNDGNTALHLAIQDDPDEEFIIDIISPVRAMAVDILCHNEMTDPSGCSSGTMDHDGLYRNDIDAATCVFLNHRNNEGKTAFWTAVRRSRCNIAKILFVNGADPTISDKYGDSPFHSSVPTDMTDEMTISMIENIAVNHVNIDGRTLLQTAICYKREALVKHLLKKGADPIFPDRGGNSALHMAIECGLNEQIIIDIIKAASLKPIHVVFQKTMTRRFFGRFIQRLLPRLNLDVLSTIFALLCDTIFDLRGKYGQTAFSYAVHLNRIDVAQILLENGADPTIADTDRSTPLHTLLDKLTDDSILSMIHNIDINHRYNDGSTLFQSAIKCRREIVVMKLLKRGANPIIADHNGNTALHLAIEHNLNGETIITILEAATPRTADILCPDGMMDPSVCSSGELVNYRLDRDGNRQATSKIINLRNQNWQTALFLAFTLARFDIVQILVERGADPNIADINGNTPLHTHMPTELTDEFIISMIENIDVNKAGEDGATFLHRAIECRREVVVKYLLKRGADPVIPDRDGNTALHLAIYHSLSKEIISIIEAAPLLLVQQDERKELFQDLGVSLIPFGG